MTFKQFRRWCVSDKDGNIVFGQRPNLPILSGTLMAVLAFVTPGYVRIVLSLISFGALFTWAWQEIFDGTTPLRRFLGGAFMVALLVVSTLLLGALT